MAASYPWLRKVSNRSLLGPERESTPQIESGWRRSTMATMRPWLLAIFLVLLVRGGLAAATPGPPLPPRPGPLPKSWFRWLNDAFGGEVETNADDFRTNAFTIGTRVGARWIAQGDLSTLTNKDGRGGQAPGRVDELTIVAGQIFARERSPRGAFTAAAGLGLRYSGDLGMGDVQNAWHRQIDFREIEAPYEEERVAGLGWFSTQWTRIGRVEGPFADSVFAAGSRFGISIDMQGLLSHRGEMQAEIGSNLLWVGHDGVIWAGVRRVMRAGDTLSRTAQVVADSEAGTWLVYGLSIGSLFFQGGLDIDSSLSTGSIGWMYRPHQLHSDHGEDVMTAEFGATLNSYGLGGQLRWRPRWLERVPHIGQRSDVFIDYRFGRDPGADLQDNSLRYQQALAGLDLALFKPKDGFYWSPFVYSGIGWRLEDVIVEGPNAEFGDGKDDSLAFQAGIGIRTTWGTRPKDGWGIQYGFSLSFDHADAFGEERIISRDGRKALILLDDQQTLTTRLIVSVGW